MSREKGTELSGDVEILDNRIVGETPLGRVAQGRVDTCCEVKNRRVLWRLHVKTTEESDFSINHI